mgnify:CR=1 FL=1|tara:strand:+ start:1510 stop:2391 length:882 start_codon:yes stop_codon:yes gene_type:complete
MTKIYLFTFCVLFGKETKKNLLNALYLLINSLEKTNNYELHVFTNLDININNNNIKFCEYFNNDIKFCEYFNNDKSYFSQEWLNLSYSQEWLNLSYNKLNIYKYLYNKYQINFLWIDLDTIVTSNIEYINDVKSYFVENGGISTYPNDLFTNKKLCVPRNRYIQGNIWKLNIDLYNDLITSFKEILNNKFHLRYDGQDLFNYHIYYKLHGKLDENNIYIAGLNYKPETINGLSIWSLEGNTHATHNGLNNMYYHNNKLKSKFYPDKEIHFVSFTFSTLNKLINVNKFKELFNK